jgi:membrane-bound lytic murein transglycosylase A
METLAPRATMLAFSDLDGWAGDDHAAALAVFRTSCGALTGPDWARPCAAAGDASDPLAFLERHFRPVLIDDGGPALFTGYFEPVLRGSRRRDAVFRHPVYGLPRGLAPGTGPTRQEIETGDVLAGQGLEIAWVDDPVDLFFMQVQGSGRIGLPDGEVIRVGYAGTNGWPYTSIGKELIARGILAAESITADLIRDWIRQNPAEGQALLWVNKSHVFFRELTGLAPDKGPLGVMNHPVTPLRTVAVDPAFVPLGAPVWIETAGAAPLRRLMVAQDTGSAIKGAQRADIFFGTGPEAGLQAGRMRDGGRMAVLLPRGLAVAMARRG